MSHTRSCVRPGKAGVAGGGTFWGHLDVEIAVRLGKANHLVLHEETAQVGWLFDLHHRLALLAAGRVGVVSYRLSRADERAATVFSYALVPELRFSLNEQI